MIRIFLFLFSFVVLYSGSCSADNGKIVFNCENGEVEFPLHTYYVCPLVRDILDHPPKKDEVVNIQYDIDANYLEIIRDLVNLLPQAARNNHGEVVSGDDINFQTIFVNEFVKKKLQPPLIFRMFELHDKTKEGILPSFASKCSTSLRLSGGTKGFSGTITQKIADAIDGISSREGQTPRSFKDAFNPILGKLYVLALELGIDPVANVLAYRMIHELPEDHNACLSGALKKQGFGNFVGDQRIYLKKHLELREKGKEELTVGDYLGSHGQPKLSSTGSVDLSHKGFTSVSGIQHLEYPELILRLNLARNDFLSKELNPQLSRRPFEQFVNLIRLNLGTMNIQEMAKYMDVRYTPFYKNTLYLA